MGLLRNLLALIGVAALGVGVWTYRDKIPWRWKQNAAAIERPKREESDWT